MKRFIFITLLAVTIFAGCSVNDPEVTASKEEEAAFADLTSREFDEISISDFSDGFNHARYQYKNSIPPYELYKTNQVLGMAENMIYFQNPDGGWAKNIDLQKIYTLEELKYVQQKNKSVPAVTYELHSSTDGSTMDNRNIHSQVKYLCAVYSQVKDVSGIDAERYLKCAEKGLNWILNAQHPVSGGFTGADVFGITYNDDVMSDALTVLRNVANGYSSFSVFPETIRAKARTAYQKGIECILKTQITVTLSDGTKLLTAWCQQHYHDNLQPRWAREFEPPSICSSESFKVLRFLMGDSNPSAELKKAIIAGVEFFDRDDVRLHDVEVVDVPLAQSVYWSDVKRTDTVERIMRSKPGNRNLWARFYALDSSFDVVKDARKSIQGKYPAVLSPIWCDRGCKYVENYMDLSQERRTGYSYTSTGFNSVLTDYAKWKQKYN